MRWLLYLILGISSVSSGYDKTPSPNFSPTDVVNIVLGGMANNDSPTPDAGLQQAFQFASPSNKKQPAHFGISRLLLSSQRMRHSLITRVEHSASQKVHR